MKIAFLCSWGESSEDLLNAYKRFTPWNSGRWNEHEGTANIQDADCIVIMEGVPPAGIGNIRLGQAVIGLPREAFPEKKTYCTLATKTAFTHRDAYQIATWRLVRPFNELVDLPFISKCRNISSVTSRLYETAGQKIRVDFLKDYVAKFPATIDVFGFGWSAHELGESGKGPLGNRFANAKSPEICKWDGLYPYRYSLACENHLVNNYFTEKLIDCFLTWTIPIYYGCPNITDFFPSEAIIAIDLLSKDAPQYLMEATQRPISKLQIEALREARRLVLYKYNLWPSVQQIIESGSLSWPGKRLTMRDRIKKLLRS